MRNSAVLNPPSENETSLPPEVSKLLQTTQELLAAGKPKEAVRHLARVDSEWTRNARAVCNLRMGDTRAALDTLRSLVVAPHLAVKPEAPTVFKTNFVTALLLTGNINGGISILKEIGDDRHESVVRLRRAVQQWKDGMSFWQRLNWNLGNEPTQPLTLDFPPGDLQ